MIDIGVVRDEAVEAVARGKLSRAIELYRQLEDAEPADPQWSKRLAETHRRAGDRAAAVTAFERTAEKYALAGFLVQAIAVCKLILQLDPDHSATQARLASWVPPTPRRRRTLAPPPAPDPGSGAIPIDVVEPSAPAIRIEPDGGLDSIDLSKLIPGTAPVLRADGTPSGVNVLPLGEPIDLEIELDDLELVDEPASTERLPGPAARRALLTTPLFPDVSPLALERLIARMRLLELSPGDELLHEGETGRQLFVISEGEVVVETAGTELARLGPSAFVGEIALVTDLPRSATIRAATHVELLEIDREVIRDAAVDHPEIVTVLLRFVRDRLIDRITRTSELFQPFTAAERRALSRRFELVEVVRDTILITQGERADGLYLVVAGKVEVWRDGESPLAALTTGDVFGELSLLAGGGSTANVRSVTRVLALRMSATTFREVIMTHPQVLAYLGELAQRRTQPAPTAFVDLHLDMLV